VAGVAKSTHTTENTMDDPPKDIAIALERLRESQRLLSIARNRYETQRNRLIAKLQDYPVIGSHPLVIHHILNTEERQLTPQEIDYCYGTTV
jgi:hypothetical protein